MVNTFLPYPNFKKSVGVLDPKTLGEQRKHVKLILEAIKGEAVGFNNHPAVAMWQNYEGPLCVYGINACNEWIRRGNEDNLIGYFLDEAQKHETCIEPWWMGIDELHRAYQSNLIRRNPKFYVELWPGVPTDLPYYWPEPEEV